MYRSPVSDCSGPSNESEREVDERVAEEELDVPEIMYDLQILNGNVKSSKYNPFWDKLALYLEELTPVVDERRHSDTPHMSVAVSLRHSRDLVKERLEKKYPADEDKQQCPSLEWIRLQFWPPNPYSSTALQHTSRFKLRFGVQVRQLSRSHPDSKYVSVLLKYLKSFTVKFHHLTTYVSINDKAIIPLGEPGLPISTGVRGHNRSIVPLQRESASVALDHNFHVHGIVPSVLFFCVRTRVRIRFILHWQSFRLL